MQEKGIEAGLRRKVEKHGGLCLKFTSPGHDGVPDRLIITGDGRVIFVELKQATGRLSPIQKYMIDRMRKHGADVRVAYGVKGVNELIEEIYGVQTARVPEVHD